MNLHETIVRRGELEDAMAQLAAAGWTEFREREYPGLTAEIARANWRTLNAELIQIKALFQKLKRLHEKNPLGVS